MDKTKIKYKGIIQRLWTDPVLSQIFSVAILALLTILYSFFRTVFKDISFKQSLLDTLYYPLELYKVFILLVIVVVAYFIYYKWRQKRKNHIGRFDVEQKVGEFSFRELYNALLTHKVNLPISLTSPQTDPKGDLLTLFMLFQRQLNVGIEWNHGGDQGIFMYHILGPTLMTYGLTEKARTKNKADSLKLDIIQTSPTGYKFYAMLERWRVYNDVIMKDDVTKTQTQTHNLGQ